METERPEQFLPFEISGLVVQSAIPLGILLEEGLTERLLECVRRERSLALDLDICHSCEREVLVYVGLLSTQSPHQKVTNIFTAMPPTDYQR
jgi:hypothetical protein